MFYCLGCPWTSALGWVGLGPDLGQPILGAGLRSTPRLSLQNPTQQPKAHIGGSSGPDSSLIFYTNGVLVGSTHPPADHLFLFLFLFFFFSWLIFNLESTEYVLRRLNSEYLGLNSIRRSCVVETSPLWLLLMRLTGKYGPGGNMYYLCMQDRT